MQFLHSFAAWLEIMCEGSGTLGFKGIAHPGLTHCCKLFLFILLTQHLCCNAQPACVCVCVVLRNPLIHLDSVRDPADVPVAAGHPVSGQADMTTCCLPEPSDLVRFIEEETVCCFDTLEAIPRSKQQD